MPIEFDCDPCGQRLRVPDAYSGKRARCPTCHSIIDIPTADPPQTPILLEDSDRIADVIDYEIFGHEMQYVEITLDPGEMAIADPDVMMYMTAGIQIATVSGDPAAQSTLLEKIVSAGKRILTGESLELASYFNTSDRREVVAFAATCPGKLIPMHLDDLGGELICQRDSFLCAARGMQISVAFQKRLMTGPFGREGFILQKLEGDGIVVVHAGGTLMYRRLNPGETLKVDGGCLVALGSTVKYDVQVVGGVKNVLGADGVFLATLTGPGDIWLQSMPLSRIMGRVLATTRGIGPTTNDGTLGGVAMHDHD